MGSSTRRDRRCELKFGVSYALLFASIAPIVGYLNLYLQQRGLSDGQIGTVTAIVALFSIISPPLWGYLSDRWGNYKLPLAVASLGSAILFPAYFFVSFARCFVGCRPFCLFPQFTYSTSGCLGPRAFGRK